MSTSPLASGSKCAFRPRHLILFFSLLVVAFALGFPFHLTTSATSRSVPQEGAANANETVIYSQPSDGRANESSSKIQGGTQYDRETADDFDLNATITRVRVRGSRGGYNMPPNPTYYGVYVRFYDGTAGAPGALQAEHFLPQGTPGVVFDAANPNTFDITLPAPFNAVGKHFLSVQPVFGGSETWSVSSGNDGNVRGSVWFKRDRAANEAWTQSVYAGRLNDMAFDLFGTLLSAPRIDAFSPSPVPRSGLVRISGGNFGARGDGQLTIDGKPSQYIAHWADNLIVAYVPENATLGGVPVVVTSSGMSGTATLNVTTRPSDGRIRWRFTVASGHTPRRPAVAPDGTVYVNDVLGRLYALAPDGGLKWVFQAGLIGARGPVSVGADGTVYVGGLVPKNPSMPCEGDPYTVNVHGIFAVRPDGTQKWLFDKTCDGLLSGPNVGPDGNIHAVAESTGIGAFALKPDGTLAHTPTGRFGVDGDTGTEIVFGPAAPGQSPTQKYFQYESGGLFGYTLEGQRVFLYPTNAVGITQPVAGQRTGTVYTMPDQQTAGNLFAVSPQGALRWVSPIRPIHSLSIPDAPPSESAVYVVQDGAKLHRVNPADGSVVWTFIDNFEQLFDPVASPDDRLVLMGGQASYNQPGFFEAVSNDGRQLWKQLLPDETGLAPYGQVVPRYRARFTDDGRTAYIAAHVSGADYSATVPAYSFFYALDTSDGDTPVNQPPKATVTSPLSNSNVPVGTEIDIKAKAEDDGQIARLDFYSITRGVQTLLGSDATPDARGSYDFKFTPTEEGVYSIVAVAYDAAGLRGDSPSVTVTVSGRPPTVSWVSPADGSGFSAPASLPLVARAADSDGQVARVEFSSYQTGVAGSNLIGSDTTPDASGNYQLDWANPPQGAYELTALAFDNSGLSRSASITITVGTPSTPTPTPTPVPTPTPTGTPGWHKQFASTRPERNGAPYETYGFAAVDAQHAWASHINAAVSHTTDGGLTWNTVEVPLNGGNNNHAQDVDFFDTQIGWVVGGEDNAVLRSDDGGRTFARQPTGLPASLFGVEAVDVNTVFAVGSTYASANGSGPVVLRTRDGGATWTEMSHPFRQHTRASFYAVHFINQTTGWVAGSSGNVIKTTNGGATWTDASVPTEEPLSDVSFADANNGWVVGYGGTLFRTSDGGATWQWQNAGTSDAILSVSAVSPTVAWIGGYGFPGFAARTSDGGATWQREYPDTSPNGTPGGPTSYSAVLFFDADTGWAAGYSGIYRRGYSTGTPQGTTYAVAGRIVNEAGEPVSGLRVRLSTTRLSASTQYRTTDADGRYSFGVVAAGENLMVVPEDFTFYYRFVPASRTYSGLAQNVADANFVATRRSYVIAGRLTDQNGNAITGATVNLLGSDSYSTETDAAGNYTFRALAGGGSYSVQPHKAQYIFSPPWREFNNLSASQTADFAGARADSTVSIGGRITTGGGSPVAGVPVRLESDTTRYGTTDANGLYKFADLPVGIQYMVLPGDETETYGFAPSLLNYDTLVQHVADANFTAATPNEPVTRTNVALAANGATASASSAYSSAYPATAINNGDRRGTNWGSGGGWNDATAGQHPDWVEIAFSGTKTIDEVDIFALQDAYANPAEPTSEMTFTKYGITDFEVRYWDAAAANWLTIPGTSVTANNTVWRKLTFSPVTTTKIRVIITGALNGYSRLAEVEAWQQGAAAPTPTPTSTQRTNVALASQGATVAASSAYSGDYAATAVNNGDRRGTGWGSGGGWNDATQGQYPDWVEVTFAGAKTIDEVDVFAIQDDYANPVEPTSEMTFTNYGVTDFTVQYWDGAAWVAIPGASVTANGKVWSKLTFSPVTTTKIRVLITNSLNGYSRLAEVEAWQPATGGTTPVRPNLALAANGATVVASSEYSSAYPATAINNGDRRGMGWGGGGGWNDATLNEQPDWVEVRFSGAKTLTEVNVFSVQDNYASPVEPSAEMTFTKYGVTDFQVQYWDGANWVAIPGASVAANGKVWSKLSFSPVTMERIRVVVTGALNGYSRFTEIEAYE